MVSDIPRNCIYTLSVHNNISIYAPNGEKSVQHLQTITNIYKSAQDKAPGSPALTPNNFAIVALHVIENNESRPSGVQLMAITANGVRLFFAPSAYGYGYSYNSGSGGSSRPLQLIHVRLPPSNLRHPDEIVAPYRAQNSTFGGAQVTQQPSSRPYILSGLEISCYCDGLTIAAQPGDTDNVDFIYCLSPDLTRMGTLGQANQPPSNQQQNMGYNQVTYGVSGTPHRPPLSEYAALLQIPGRTWAMAVAPRTTVRASSTPPGSPSPVVTNELATQFSEAPPQFMILTNAGLTILTKRRAADYLKAVIEEVASEGNSQPIIEFRDR